MAVASGIGGQIVATAESTYGVAPSLSSARSYEFKSETLELKKKTVQGAATKFGALKKAANVIKDAARGTAASMANSTRIPDRMNVQINYSGGYANIRAGIPGGKYGWTPIHAWMFEEPHAGRIPKHPLFAHGPRGTDGWRYWYYQPYKPYMETAAEESASAAAQVYADEMLDYFARKFGYPGTNH